MSSELLFANQKLNEEFKYLPENSSPSSTLTNATALNLLNKSIYLEIRRGGNGSKPLKFNDKSLNDNDNLKMLDGSVKIGEPITLAVHAKPISKGFLLFEFK